MPPKESKPQIIVILGPTASGKTALSLLIAKNPPAGGPGEIISADSRQIYREMDIGTAKATRDEQAGIPHYLIDIKNPDEDYSLAQFKQDAEAAIFDIASRKMLPIVVGGTAQYVYALIDNWQIPEVKENPELREKLEKEIAAEGLEKIYQKLLDLDPEAAYIVDPKNPRRVIRALEVAISTGQPFTKQRQKAEPLFDCLLLGIKVAPAELAKRIEQRVDDMLAAGLVEEVKSLVKKYPADLKIFDTIGYRELLPCLRGETTLGQARAEIVSNTNHFARRQMQWFKRDQRINWIADQAEALALAQAFLE